MRIRRKQPAWWALALIATFWMLVILPLSAVAAPYASMVMDARNGKVLYARNADTRLHPASLTKMMTLYIAFEAIKHGEISLDTKVRISKHAASEPPSKLGLRAGQTIALRYLIRAAAIKSANDAATAIGEAISGSEANFAARMNRTAKSMGMKRTTFKNAHGLTQSGHLSTARDMTILGRHLFYDYPKYYNLFSRIQSDAGVKMVRHTNRALLQSYRGADGIKTGYTKAAGFNLVASAERGRERVIATVFGGKSTSSRNAHVAELLDLGFQKAPTRVAVHRPKIPAYRRPSKKQPNNSAGDMENRQAPAPKKKVTVVKTSMRPQMRKVAAVSPAPEPVQLASAKADIEKVLQEMAQPKTNPKVAENTENTVQQIAALATTSPKIRPATIQPPKAVKTASSTEVEQPTDTVQTAQAAPKVTPQLRPKSLSKPTPKSQKVANATTSKQPVLTQKPAARQTVQAALEQEQSQQQKRVTRVSTSGGRHWGINIGRYPSRSSAQRVLLKTALAESSTLDGSLRKIIQRSNGYDANFVGMTQETADLACRRLQARQLSCFTIGPG